jgi:hypothetical protein
MSIFSKMKGKKLE